MSLTLVLLAPWTPLTALEGPLPPVEVRQADRVFSVDYGRELLGDAGRVVTGPARWEARDWQGFSWALAGVVGSAVLLDRPLRDAAERNRTPGRDRFADRLGSLGTVGAAGIVGGLYLYGAVKDDRDARRMALDGLTASIIASGLITPVTKWVVGRGRPEDTRDPASFRPFHRPDPGFPSNHTVEAFAVASVISAHCDSPWAGGLAYGLAGLVGLSRIQLNQHYASDVVAGALLGTVVGRAVVFSRPGGSGRRVTLEPSLAPGGAGVTFRARF
jgi:membrane-associated phospholipid phosphatase